MKTVSNCPNPIVRSVETRSKANRPIGHLFGVSIYIAVMIVMAASAMETSVRSETIVEGTVKLPPPKPPPAASARYQQKAGAVAAPDPPVAVVYLEGAMSGVQNPGQAEQTIKQKSFQFMPAVLAIQKGTSVTFPNFDEDYHHVFSFSKAKEFDLGRYRMDEKAPAVLFDKSGVVKIGCEIHDHMRAMILVLDTPHFTTTTPDGKYHLTLKGVPDGKYTVKAWINEKTVFEQPVEVKQGSTVQVNFAGK